MDGGEGGVPPPSGREEGASTLDHAAPTPVPPGGAASPVPWGGPPPSAPSTRSHPTVARRPKAAAASLRATPVEFVRASLRLVVTRDGLENMKAQALPAPAGPGDDPDVTIWVARTWESLMVPRSISLDADYILDLLYVVMTGAPSISSLVPRLLSICDVHFFLNRLPAK